MNMYNMAKLGNSSFGNHKMEYGQFIDIGTCIGE